MAERITFPDIEGVLASWYSATTEVPAYGGTTPPQFPDRSVTFVRTGGVHRDIVVDVPTVSIDCRSGLSEADALDVASDVRGRLHEAKLIGMLEEVPLYEVSEASGPYLNPDPLNPDQHRYTINVALAVRGFVV